MHFAINGQGRIGRALVRAYFQHKSHYPHLTLKAINDPHDPNALVHLLKYDSVHGCMQDSIHLQDPHTLIVNNTPIALYQSRDPKRLPWSSLGIHTVLECTGALKTKALASGHLDAGAEQVILSCPSSDADATVVLGANDHRIKTPAPILSIGSCTTNALAPILAYIDQDNPIQHGFMTTIHAYTNDQSLVDKHHSDLRRARAAQHSIIPTKTGAAKAIGQVLPHLEGKLQGYALRVPTSNVSALEITLTLEKPVDQSLWIERLRKHCQLQPKGVLSITEEPLVSVDFNQHPASAIIDLSTVQTYGYSLKLLAWYDNEWAYALRLLDTAALLQRTLQISATETV